MGSGLAAAATPLPGLLLLLNVHDPSPITSTSSLLRRISLRPFLGYRTKTDSLSLSLSLSLSQFIQPIARNISFTFIAVLAEVSINSRLFSSAYTCASCIHTHTHIAAGDVSHSVAYLIFHHSFAGQIRLVT